MAEINAPLTLYGSVTNITESAWWSGSDGDGDPYVGYAYQWTITVQINPQSIGNWSEGFQYTEANVQVGNWIVMTSALPSTSLEIISISSATGSILTCVVEDIDRYNLMLTGTAGINPVSASGTYDALIFALGDDGLAVFADVTPFTIPVTVTEEVQSRLRYRNYLQNNYSAYQAGNTFAVGDELMLNSDGTYSLATASGAGALNVVGQVVDINIPGAGYFTYQPVGRVINNISPNLPGNPGSIIYADPANPGQLTATPPTTGVAVPLYIQINTTTGIQLTGEDLGALDNLNANAAPTSSADSTLGYSWGSMWVDRATSQAYINVDPTASAAVWQEIGAGTTGPTGPAGPTGADSTVTGPTGDVGPTGPTGADSTVTGPTGPNGVADAAGTTGEIQFNDGLNNLDADPNLFWDNTNKRIGIGTQTPYTTIQFGQAMLEYTSSNTSNTTPIAIDSFDVTQMRSAHYYAQITDEDNNIYQVSQITVMQDGSTAYSTEYNILAPLGNLGTFNTTIITGNCVLLFTPSLSTNKTIKVSRSAIGI